ncbi:Helix-turn-helix domain protein [Gemmata sp. SH-PL17]|uniref:helix-turn-helix domain-containing protein n=1 Tax=Gemmata sp. SH-PL17 TaxID=1630693 RepID=UPI00078C80C5|nr:helix-turn-helix domain-containing protein [Gemmata sp. SH-PL17]AMV24244.1 Helix-turn-helix domain protein [Gemmata sp. SH-PL17]
MLTVAQAAVYATVSERLIREWVTSGLLPVLRLGAKGRRGHIRIQREDLDATLAAFKVTRAQPGPRRHPARKPALKHLRLS